MEEKVKSWYSAQCTLQVNCVLYLFLILQTSKYILHIHNEAHCVLVLFDIRLATNKKSSKIYKCQERLSSYHGLLWPPSGFWREEGRAPLHPTLLNAYVLFRLPQTGNGGEGTKLHNRQCLWLDRICKINKHLDFNPFLCAADIFKTHRLQTMRKFVSSS